MYIRDTFEKNTTDVLRTNNVAKFLYCLQVFLTWLSGMLVASCLRRIIISSLFCLAVPYFSHIIWLKERFPKKKVIEHKIYIWIASTNFVQNTSHSKKRPPRYYRKCTHIFVSHTNYSCQFLMKLEFSRQIFEKIHKYKISWNPTSWIRVVSYIQSVWGADMTNLIAAFLNFANAPNKTKNSCSLS
jgi:hypothetical protein